MPEENKLKKWAEANGVSGSPAEVVKDPRAVRPCAGFGKQDIPWPPQDKLHEAHWLLATTYACSCSCQHITSSCTTTASRNACRVMLACLFRARQATVVLTVVVTAS